MVRHRLLLGVGALAVVGLTSLLAWAIWQAPGVTWTNYQRIQLGMSKADVAAILGGSPKEYPSAEVQDEELTRNEQIARVEAISTIPKRWRLGADGRWAMGMIGGLTVLEEGTCPWVSLGESGVWSDVRRLAIGATFDGAGKLIWKGFRGEPPSLWHRLSRVFPW